MYHKQNTLTTEQLHGLLNKAKDGQETLHVEPLFLAALLSEIIESRALVSQSLDMACSFMVGRSQYLDLERDFYELQRRISMEYGGINDGE